MSSEHQKEIDTLDEQYNQALTLRNSAVDRLREQDSKFKNEYHSLIDSNLQVRDQIYAADSEIEKLKSELAVINNSIKNKNFDLEDIEREQKMEDEENKNLSSLLASTKSKIPSSNSEKANISDSKDAMVEEIGVLDGKLKTSYSNIRDAEESLLKSRNENLLIENDIRNVDYDSFKLDSILQFYFLLYY